MSTAELENRSKGIPDPMSGQGGCQEEEPVPSLARARALSPVLARLQGGDSVSRVRRTVCS